MKRWQGIFIGMIVGAVAGLLYWVTFLVTRSSAGAFPKPPDFGEVTLAYVAIVGTIVGYLIVLRLSESFVAVLWAATIHLGLTALLTMLILNLFKSEVGWTLIAYGFGMQGWTP